MKTRHDIAVAIREARRASGLTQEDFAVVSSRTYISILERGLKSPTLDKVDDIAGLMQVHPMTLLALAYLDSGEREEIDDLCRIVRNEVARIMGAPGQPPP